MAAFGFQFSFRAELPLRMLCQLAAEKESVDGCE